MLTLNKIYFTLLYFIWSDGSPALFQETLMSTEIQSQIDAFTKIKIDDHKYDSKNVIDEPSMALTNILTTTAN